MALNIQIKVPEKVYLKEPDSSELGKKIVKYGAQIINEIGFEQFTFKKLATQINSTEASIYRYFENKHKLLIYLVSWYWNWLEYKLQFNLQNISRPEDRLKIALKIVTQNIEQDPEFEYIDEELLYKIVVAEASKAYLTKEVDEDNKEGYFSSYKRLVGEIANLVTEINPYYPYPRAIISTVIETAHEQKFFAEHLPSLTEIHKQDTNKVVDYLTDLVFRVIR